MTVPPGMNDIDRIAEALALMYDADDPAIAALASLRSRLEELEAENERLAAGSINDDVWRDLESAKARLAEPIVVSPDPSLDG